MKTLKYLMIVALTVIVFGCSSANDADDCEVCNYTVPSSETAGTVPAALIGTFNLTLDLSLNGYSVQQGTNGTFTVSATQMIVDIDGEECITLNNPIQTSPSEWTFKDNCRDDLMYAISLGSSGSLNEVNVITINGTFIGQFIE